jgi:hypothetical protein
MDKQRPIVAVVFLFACIPYSSEAQEPTHPVEVPSIADTVQRINSASIVFERNLNTYTWLGRVAVDTLVEAIRIGLLEQYASNVILPEGTPSQTNPKLQSSQQSLSLTLRGPSGGGFAPLGQWSSFAYSDNKGIGLNNASTSLILGGFEYAPLPWLSVTPLAGYQWDGQAGIYDRGPTYVVGALIPGLIIDGYRVAGIGQYREEKLSPRTLEANFLRAGVQKNFSSYTEDSLEVGFARNRREFYSPGDFDIESRVEQVLSFSNNLRYDLDPSLSSIIFVSVNDRVFFKDLRPWKSLSLPQTQFNTRIDEFRIDAYALLAYRSPDGSIGGWLRLGRSERTESHEADRPSSSSPLIELQYATRNNEEQLKNNTSVQTTLSGGGALSLSPSDTILVSGTAGMLRYDTPSVDNVEDRDELLIALGVTTRHRVSSVLDLAFTVEGTLGHTVYLLKERSRNNSVNRILRFSPRTVYHPVSQITSVNAFEVLANYTVYDFEAQLASIKSYSYRQFVWLDSTAFDVTHSLGFDLFTYWKVYERGQLIWNAFLERPENIVNEQTHSFQVRVRPSDQAVFALGLRYFGQARYAYEEGERKLDTFLSSVGPTCMISWEPGMHSRIQFQGWYEYRRLPDGSLRSLPSMTMNINVNL